MFTLLTVFPLVGPEQRTEAATGTASTTSLTLTTTGGASLDLAVNSLDGTFNETTSTTGQAKFTVTTTNYTGYNLSISNEDNNTNLTATGTTNHPTIASIGTATGSSTVPSTGISATTFNTTAYNGMWGYKPSKLNSSPNSNYLPAPTTTATTINITNCANGGSNGSNTCPNSIDTYTIDLAARLEYTQASGTYTNTFILNAIGNPITYTINYADNTGDSSVTGAPISPNTPTSGDTSGTSITLSSAIPTRAGYTFSKWCQGTVSNNGTTCTGTQYAAGSSFGIDKTTINTTTLYALWTPNNTTYSLNYNANSGTNAPTSQSNTNNTGSYNFTINTATIPTRSNYFFLGYATSSSATTPEYTYSSSSKSFSPSTITLTRPSATSTTTSTTLYAVWQSNYMQDASVSFLSDVIPSNGDSITLKDRRDSNSYQITRIGNRFWMTSNLRITGTITATDSNFTGSNFNVSAGDLSSGDSYTQARTKTGSDGNGNPTTWYNFCAASAGTNCQSSTVTDTTVDICPKGWRLPTNDEYLALADRYTDYVNTHFSLYGGSWRGGSLDKSSTTTNYWSSTAGIAPTNQYALYYNLDQAPGTYPDLKGYGFYVRCVFNGTNATLSMQNATVSSLSTMMPSNGDSVNLYDARDLEDYQITRINDQYWMTENLRINSTVPMEQSNYYGGDFNVSAGDLSSGNTYTQARTHTATDGSGKSSTWYNYCALSAGSICTSSDSTTANADICPVGWRLPTSSELSSLTSYKSYFNPTTGGYYNGSSSPASTNYGYYWAADASSSTNRYALSYNGSSLSTTNLSRQSGAYVRCIKDYSTYPGYTYMQDFAGLSKSARRAMGQSMVSGQVYTLSDKRDSTSYKIAKLADDRVWMIQDLKLGKTTSSMALTSTTSDVSSSGFTLNNKLSNGNFPYAGSGEDSYYNGSAYYCASAYGCYYNWYTATAGSGTSSVSVEGINVDYSICPAGWTLPTAGNGGEFEHLVLAYGANPTSMLVPNPTTTTENTSGAVPGFLLNNFYYSLDYNKVAVGEYWSRTARSDMLAYFLSITVENVYSNTNTSKSVGFAVRCILK